MKAALIFLALVAVGYGQYPSAKNSGDRLRIELRVISDRVQISGDLGVTVLFRSEKDVTLWNFLAFCANAGLNLRVFDTSGHELPTAFALPLDPVPPDLDGKDALISIGGNVFAGFDSHIPVKLLFPKPGRYTIECDYSAPLTRNYFRGQNIWGKEDGAVTSNKVLVLVE